LLLLLLLPPCSAVVVAGSGRKWAHHRAQFLVKEGRHDGSGHLLRQAAHVDLSSSPKRL
jgi:hypothetical protein